MLIKCEDGAGRAAQAATAAVIRRFLPEPGQQGACARALAAPVLRNWNRIRGRPAAPGGGAGLIRASDGGGNVWDGSLIATCVLCLSASLACAAGLQRIEVPAGGGGAAIAGAVWYPCARPVTEVALARLHVTASPDCPVTGNGLPLVVISHGYGGNLAGHHDTAETLADAGFVAVAINHPVDSDG